MSTEQNCHDHSIEETLEYLFNKKYVYPRNAQWALECTSVIGPLIKACRSVCEKDVKHHHKQSVTPTHTFCQTGQTEAEYAAPEQEVKCQGQYLRMNHQTGLVQHHQNGSAKVVPPLPVMTPSDMEHWANDCEQSSSEQVKSPQFQDGRHQPPNKFRRKTAPPGAACRLLRTVSVILPSPWRHEKLLAQRDKLNALKDQLSDKDMISWHQHTNFTNPAGQVVGVVKTQYGAELCTQAWCKFHEIMASQPQLLPPAFLCPPHYPHRLNSVHLCEAPGAFITSLNHYLVSRGLDTQERWCWLGTTLNPYYEGNDTGRMISDDRFIRTTHPHWFFGADNSGDLMSVDNMRALMDRAQRMGDIHLVTADGSIDCQENPAEQEVIVSRLHHCEVLCSCLLLAPGGSLVLKLFTMWEASSVALMFFLSCVFQQVSVCKPATSKSGNSEVYAVCSGYTASLSQQVLLSLFAAVCAREDNHVVLLPREDIPADFMSAHEECCLYFSGRQSQTISNNLCLHDDMTDAQSDEICKLQEACVQEYVRHCQLQPISNEDRITPYGLKSYFSRFFAQPHLRSRSRPHGRMHSVGSSSVSLHLHHRQGTFHQRQRHSQLSWQQQLQQMQDYVVDSTGHLIKRRQKISEEAVQQWHLIYGKGFEAAVSSQFVDSQLLGDLHTFLEQADVRFHQQKSWSERSTSALEHAAYLLHYMNTTITPHPRRRHQHQQHCYLPSPEPELYHLALEGSLTGFWPGESVELSALSLRRLGGQHADLLALESQGVVGVVVDVTQPDWGRMEEVGCQGRLVEVVLNICSYLQTGSSVALIMPVALTRLTAGVLYILATLFQETCYAVDGPNPFLYQTLVLHNFSAPSYSLLTLLEKLRRALSPSTHSLGSLSLPYSHLQHPTRNLSFSRGAELGCVSSSSRTGHKIPDAFTARLSFEDGVSRLEKGVNLGKKRAVEASGCEDGSSVGIGSSVGGMCGQCVVWTGSRNPTAGTPSPTTDPGPNPHPSQYTNPADAQTVLEQSQSMTVCEHEKGPMTRTDCVLTTRGWEGVAFGDFCYSENHTSHYMHMVPYERPDPQTLSVTKQSERLAGESYVTVSGGVSTTEINCSLAVRDSTQGSGTQCDKRLSPSCNGCLLQSAVHMTSTHTERDDCSDHLSVPALHRGQSDGHISIRSDSKTSHPFSPLKQQQQEQEQQQQEQEQQQEEYYDHKHRQHANTVVDPGTCCSVDAVDPGTGGSVDAVDPGTRGSVDAVDPGTRGSVDAVDPGTGGSVDAVDPGTGGSVDAVDPGTRGSVDAVDPGTGGSVDAVDPETQGSVDAVDPGTGGSVDAVDPGTGGSVDAVDPETRGSVDAVDPGTGGSVDAMDGLHDSSSTSADSSLMADGTHSSYITTMQCEQHTQNWQYGQRKTQKVCCGRDTVHPWQYGQQKSQGACCRRETVRPHRCSQCAHSASGGDPGLKRVPLEIVPVLDLLNDVTFTHFLQASNNHSVTRFLAAMKAAELQHLVS